MNRSADRYEQRRVADPFLSISVPQFNRTSFLIESCRSIAHQTFRDVEICISDDQSTDGRSDELLDLLETLDVGYVYRRQPKNTRYDANLRSAIDLAGGRYCFLLGNDDSLASDTVIEELHQRLLGFERAGVVITNYQDYASGQVTARVTGNRVVGSGPFIAARNFRSFSFVSGIVLNTSTAKRAATADWDGSEYYQMFLGSRMIAEGHPLVALDLVTVRKDIQIAGELVDSYRSKPIPSPRRIVERPINVVTIGPLVVDAIRPHTARRPLQKAAVQVFLQLLMFTYPFWIYEYRRVRSWNYAAGVCLAMRPRRILKGQDLSARQRILIATVYGAVTVVGLLTPIVWFQRLTPRLYVWAKSFGQIKPTSIKA
jgi:glycosyltransferase involved in cell wall biosynthesis